MLDRRLLDRGSLLSGSRIVWESEVIVVVPASREGAEGTTVCAVPDVGLATKSAKLAMKAVASRSAKDRSACIGSNPSNWGS